MTIQEIKRLVEKIVSGMATEEEVLLYIRVCSFWESPEIAPDHTPPGDLQEIKISMKKAILQKAGIGKTVD